MKTDSPRNEEILYSTGCSSEGTTLIGGAWTLWSQEGFPLELYHLLCRDNGWSIDWMEAMADASRSNDCPSLMKQVKGFLSEDTILHLKLGFVAMVKSGKSFDQIIQEKRENGRRFDAFAHALASKLSQLSNQ